MLWAPKKSKRPSIFFWKVEHFGGDYYQVFVELNELAKVGWNGGTPPKTLDWWSLRKLMLCLGKLSDLRGSGGLNVNFFPASWNTPFELLWSGGYSFSMPVPFHQRCLGAKISVSLCFMVFPHLIPSTICFSFASRNLIFFPGSKLHALRGTLQGGTWATRSWCPRQWKSRTE